MTMLIMIIIIVKVKDVANEKPTKTKRTFQNNNELK